MVQVNRYSVQVKYSGDFEDYTDQEFFQMALQKCDRGVDAFDYSLEVLESEAKKLDGKVEVENAYPCNSIAVVRWSYIEEAEEEDE